jgi:hypothetical protein
VGRVYQETRETQGLFSAKNRPQNVFVCVKVGEDFLFRFRDVKDDAGRLANERKISVEREDFKFNFHAVSIAAKREQRKIYFANSSDLFR